MTDIVETPLNRAVDIDNRRVFDLSMVRLPQSDLDVAKHRELYESLPREMTLSEVNTLGLRVSSLAEAIVPSRDRMSNGRKAEMRSLKWLGSASLLHGDLVSYQAIQEHMQSLGLRGKLAALALRYEEKFN